ncbi:MAG: type II toxin-antitoxin system VapC family toxin [Acidobacteria bacterium]|nr:type II toxin-antitoxin system VapC family toxin [Acidobacteriota bacterium]
MPGVIVDTDVASYLFKEDSRAEMYEPHLAGAIASISFMTLAELEQWAILRKWGARRHAELMRFIKSRFIIIDSTAALCRQWAEVRGNVTRIGRHIETADAWVAATALLYGVPLITHNATDFEHVPGINIITEP